MDRYGNDLVEADFAVTFPEGDDGDRQAVAFKLAFG